MENKYYVPEIEEFHVGFEYEYVTNMGVPTDDDSKWDSFLFGDQEKFKSWDWRLLLQDCLKRKLIRVKHLDREDIESLCFVQRDYDTFDFKTKNNDIGYALEFNPKVATFIYQTGYKNGTLFQGKIKNKSELKKLLAQLNII